MHIGKNELGFLSYIIRKNKTKIEPVDQDLNIRSKISKLLEHCKRGYLYDIKEHIHISNS